MYNFNESLILWISELKYTGLACPSSRMSVKASLEKLKQLQELYYSASR